MTKIGLYAIANSTTPKSNKSAQKLSLYTVPSSPSVPQGG